MTVNVKSMFLACKHVLPIMVGQGCGSIVNNSSLASLRFAYPSAAYSASKGAVNELTRNIAGQYAPQGIRWARSPPTRPRARSCSRMPCTPCGAGAS